ncbi:hypothetical protein SANTM175S_01156 [Streptomyces antimycoticus]
MPAGAPRVFVSHLAGVAVFDPNGDQVGRVRDVVAMLRLAGRPPRVLGLVVEVVGRRRIFLPMTRVTVWSPVRSSPPACSTCAASNSAPPRPWSSANCSTARCGWSRPASR